MADVHPNSWRGNNPRAPTRFRCSSCGCCGCRKIQAAAGARIFVQIAETEAHRRLDPSEAASPFNLTQGEARVACEIYAGEWTLSEVGAALRIGVNTVKTQFKCVYDKTGARSRTELTLLLANSLRAAEIV